MEPTDQEKRNNLQSFADIETTDQEKQNDLQSFADMEPKEQEKQNDLQSFADMEPTDKEKQNDLQSFADRESTDQEKQKNEEAFLRPKYVQTHKPKLRDMQCYDVNIVKATNLHNGVYDMFDTPDAFVELNCPETAEKRHLTGVMWNDRNPVFNETVTFTQTQDNPVLNITVREKNNILCDGVHGQLTCPINQTPNDIKLYEDASLSVNVSCQLKSPDLRPGSELCQGEEDFRRARHPVVHAALQKLLGNDIPGSPPPPGIAVLGSGGGFRAMMGMSGVYKALADTGLLDCVMYSVGLSGTSWYLSTLCSHPDWPNIHPSEVDDHLRKCVGKSVMDTILSLRTLCDSYNSTQKCGQPWTFTDLFGNWVGQTLIPDRMQAKWTDQQEKVRDGRCPLPLLSCIHAKVDKSVKEFQEWVEISPFEVHMPKYATSVKLENFGSKFYKGKMTDIKTEFPLHLLMGICGSAYTALHKSFSEMSAKSTKLSSSTRGTLDDWNPSAPMNEDLSLWIDYIKGILDKLQLNYLDDRTGRAAKIYSFMHQLSLEQMDELDTQEEGSDNVFKTANEPMSTADEYMCLIDAGLACNSPYPIILRPERQVDLILSFEFSDRHKDDNHPFKQLLVMEEWAKHYKVPFPPIDIKQYEGKEVQELYVFQDEADLNCPIILHFVLVNNHFRHQYKQGSERTEEDMEFSDFSIFDDGTYDSMKFEFTETQFLRISRLMEFNVNLSLDTIKEYVGKAMERRQRLSPPK